MQHMILALALVSVPPAMHKLANPTSLDTFFAGEKNLVLTYCDEDIPVIYSTYPGPSLIPGKTIISCVPEKGFNAIQIICSGEYTCIVYESTTPAVELNKLIKEWIGTKKLP